jgi:hypothetical protein
MSYCQYNETNVMHISLNLLSLKSLYMFRALLAHPQDALHKRQLVYCVRVMSVGCAMITVTAVVEQPTDITRTQYTKTTLKTNIPPQNNSISHHLHSAITGLTYCDSQPDAAPTHILLHQPLQFVVSLLKMGDKYPKHVECV